MTLGMAFDIGTTTLAASLWDLELGRQLAADTALNPQRACGADVISRIGFANKPQGLAKLRGQVLFAMVELILQLCRKAGVDNGDIVKIVLAGNTTMIYIIAGRPLAKIGAAPHSIAGDEPVELAAASLFLPVAADCRILSFAAAGAFIGGDITAALALHDLLSDGRTRLLIDLGTNGELVLASGGRLTAASCAAGPAFEGMNISCGGKAGLGAIEHLSFADGGVSYQVIGGGAPFAICGSGLIEGLSSALQEGLVSPSGRAIGKAWQQDEEGKKVLPIVGKIAVTTEDIRALQLAKAAVSAAVEGLLKGAGIAASQVDEVLVAGAFGEHLSTDALIGATLLPPEFWGKIHYLGNTALAGAEAALADESLLSKAKAAVADMQILDLAAQDDYEQSFIKAMSFAVEDMPCPFEAELLSDGYYRLPGVLAQALELMPQEELFNALQNGDKQALSLVGQLTEQVLLAANGHGLLSYADTPLAVSILGRPTSCRLAKLLLTPLLENLLALPTLEKLNLCPRNALVLRLAGLLPPDQSKLQISCLNQKR